MESLKDNLNTAIQTKSIIEGFYKAFTVGDIPTVLGGMDSKIVWNVA